MLDRFAIPLADAGSGAKSFAMPQQLQIDLPHSLQDLLRGALDRSPFFGKRAVAVEILPDAIVLSGVVGSYYQKQMAQESLRPYLGSVALQNRLQVASPTATL